MYIRKYVVRHRYIYPNDGISEIKRLYYDTKREAVEMVETLEAEGHPAEWCLSADDETTPTTLDD